jgi:hypothetical protein
VNLDDTPALDLTPHALFLFYAPESSAENTQTLTLTMSLKGIRIQQFHANAKIGQDIVTHLADEVGLSSDAIIIDTDNLREQEEEEVCGYMCTIETLW